MDPETVDPETVDPVTGDPVTGDPETFEIVDPDGVKITVDRYLPPGPPRAVVHVVHGAGEHAGRYRWLAGRLNDASLAVYVDDHRGHGRTGIANGGLGALGPRGSAGVVDAVRAVTVHAAAQHPGLPVVVIGHSWGSRITQRYLRLWGAGLAAVAMTGTGPTARTLPAVNRNAAFEPARTPYDWLTRDPAEVDLYINDPWCGAGSDTFAELRQGWAELASGDDRSIPADLPIYIANGSDDLDGHERARLLADQYRQAGVSDVTFVSYPGGRHELFNEINRDEVVADLLGWLDRHLP